MLFSVVMIIIPMIMLTLPAIFPPGTAVGFDSIWFGVIMVIMMEMGQITPPEGINVFVRAEVAPEVPVATIFKGIFPLVLGEVIVIIILILYLSQI
jgi:TRAP-type C4-dicarboxylate transport system permease large subunit